MLGLRTHGDVTLVVADTAVALADLIGLDRGACVLDTAAIRHLVDGGPSRGAADATGHGDGTTVVETPPLWLGGWDGRGGIPTGGHLITSTPCCVQAAQMRTSRQSQRPNGPRYTFGWMVHLGVAPCFTKVRWITPIRDFGCFGMSCEMSA